MKKFQLTWAYREEAATVEQMIDDLGEYLSIKCDSESIIPEKKAFFELLDAFGSRPDLSIVRKLDDLDLTPEELYELESDGYVDIIGEGIEELEARVTTMLKYFGIDASSVTLDEDYYRGAGLSNETTLSELKDFLMLQIIEYKED